MKTALSGLWSCILLAVAAVIFTPAAHVVKVQRWQQLEPGMIAIAQLPQKLGLGTDEALQEIRSAPTAHGTRTIRMQQVWHGIPVFGRVLTVEADANGRASILSGSIVNGLSTELSSATARLDPLAARKLWRAQSGVKSADATIEERQADLYVYAQAEGRARLIYLVSHFVGGAHPSRPTAMMDADTGQVIKRWDGLAFAEAVGPGGNEKTGKYMYGMNRPYLPVLQEGGLCTMRNGIVRTSDMGGEWTGFGKPWVFDCPVSEGDAINGGYGPINDAHYFGNKVVDMYQAYLNTLPLTGMPLLLLVHAGKNFENAAWTGVSMIFGDGYEKFYPVVGLDVVGHEVSHGFTEQNSGLLTTGQAGAINESFSDTAGEAVKWFSRGRNDFLVGAEVLKDPEGVLRYMCDPTRDGVSIDHARDYQEGMKVHDAAGIYNKAVCLIAKNDGWDMEKTFKIFARANMLYWTPEETFDSGACGVQRAAADLGYAEKDVAGAFSQVGVACI